MIVKCGKCQKEYNTDDQVLCVHHTDNGRIFYINLLHEDNLRSQ